MKRGQEGSIFQWKGQEPIGTKSSIRKWTRRQRGSLWPHRYVQGGKFQE